MTLCISYKGAIGVDAVTLLLVLQYTADMSWIKGVINHWMTLSNSLVRARRFLDLSLIP